MHSDVHAQNEQVLSHSMLHAYKECICARPLTQTIVVIVDIQTHKYASKSPTHLFNNKCRHKHSDIFSKTIYNPVRSMCVAVQKGVREKCGMGGSWRQKT